MYERILVPLDGSDTARAGLLAAAALAAARRSMLFLTNVIDDSVLIEDLTNAIDMAPIRAQFRRRGQAVLDEAKALCEARGLRVETRLCEHSAGRVARAIVHEASAVGAGLIVIGSHGRDGLRRAVMGSTAEGVLRESTVPVLVTRAPDVPGAAAASPPPTEPYRRLLVPVDGSATSDRGLEQAIQLASAAQGRLKLLHVVDELSLAVTLHPAATLSLDWIGLLREGGTCILQQAAERVRAAGLEVETMLVDNFEHRLWQVVAREASAWQADLIVLGSHGRRGIERLFIGSDAEQILRHAPLPVLLVHAPDPVPGRSVRTAAAAAPEAVNR